MQNPYASPYQDLDGDGVYDHVVGPDGALYAYDAATGDYAPVAAPSPAGGVPAAAAPVPSEGFSTDGVPASFENRGGGGGYSAPPANFGGGSAPRPAYATGQMHPAWGGAPLTPGGRFATESGGYDTRQQVSVPGGATAGPFAVRAAPGPSGQSYGGSASGGGGGGGSTRGVISAWRSKLLGSAYPGGSSGSYSPYEYPEPKAPRLTGYARRFDPQQAAGLRYRPSMLLPKVASGLSATSPRYADLASLPMAQLAMLSGKPATQKLPSAPDYAQTQGDYNRQATRQGKELSGYVNNLARTYDRLANQDAWFDYDDLSGNLFNANPRTSLGSQFADQPAGTAASNFLSYFGALANTTLPEQTAGAYSYMANALADKYGAKYLKKAPDKAPPINRWMEKRLVF